MRISNYYSSKELEAISEQSKRRARPGGKFHAGGASGPNRARRSAVAGALERRFTVLAALLTQNGLFLFVELPLE